MIPRAGGQPRGKGGPARLSPPSRTIAAGRVCGEEGFVGGFEGLLFGLLLFVVGTLLVANAWGVVDTKSAAVEAARQAARTYVESPNATVGEIAARQAAIASLAGYGRDPALARVSFGAQPFARCQRITVSVSYPAPVVMLPFLGRVGRAESVRADHSELIDPYRSGLPGTAACA